VVIFKKITKECISPLDPDPDSQYGSGSTKSLNPDPQPCYKQWWTLSSLLLFSSVLLIRAQTVRNQSMFISFVWKNLNLYDCWWFKMSCYGRLFFCLVHTFMIINRILYRYFFTILGLNRIWLIFSLTLFCMAGGWFTQRFFKAVPNTHLSV
jgi:hypothetical protein